MVCMQKACSRCNLSFERTSEFFHHNKSTKDGFRPECKTCFRAIANTYGSSESGKRARRDRYAADIDRRRAQNLEWYHRHRDESKNRAYVKQYGITLEQYEQQVLAQQGKCCICTEETKLLVDHNHVTGKFRALLCKKCNFAIGLVDERPETLRRAAEYLEFYGSSSV